MAPIAADAATITSSVAVLEPRRGCKVEAGEGTRFSQSMPVLNVRLSRHGTAITSSTYGLGMTDRSSNEDARGRCTGVAGE